MEINSSSDYKKYKRNEKIKIFFLRLLVLVIFLVLWEVLSKLNIIDAFLFSSPTKVFETFIKLILQGELLYHTQITVIETIVAFILSTCLGVIFGITLWYFETLKKVCDPYIVLLNSIPKTAIAPLIIVWFGIGYDAIIIVAISIGVFATTLSYLNTLEKIDENKIKLIYILKGTKKDVLTKVVIPYSKPSLISICKVNIGLSLIGVIIGEFLVAKKGLGYMIIYGSQIFNMDNVILSICILSAIAYFLYKIINKFESESN